MDRPSKPLVRLALAIHRALVIPCSRERLIELPTGAWQSATELVRRLRRAELHRWHLAAATLRGDLRHTLSSLQSPLIELERTLVGPSCNPYLARPTDIYRDLVAIEEEFAALSFDCRFHTLSVTTEPITLVGHFLGPFEVRLDLRQLKCESCYRVIALDPHPAASREGVTHPHVLDELLCEGDGRAAIRQALVQGRLLDFFQLVANLLRTYNAESPFVELALWHGEDCSDCGETVTPEYRFLCERCEDAICSDCQTTCGDCECSFCNSCISKCPNCLDAYCGRCLTGCSACTRVVCSECLDEQERCPDCHEEELPEELDAPAEAAGAPIHADELGQTVLSAGCG